MPDRHKPISSDRAHQLVHLTAQRLRRFNRRHRHRDDNARRRLCAHRVNRRPHRSARRQAIVNQNHHLILELHRRARSAIHLLTPQQFAGFPCDHSIERGLINRVCPQRMLIEDLNTAAGNRAHRQLLMGRNAQFAHQHQVEANVQRGRHFIRHRHTATGQGEDDDIGAMRVLEQRRHQPPTGIGAVLQNCCR
ncbi:hypothetical protein D3C84_874790 [compost metagenome]